MYCRTRDACQEVAARLSSKSICAKPYHAGKLSLVTLQDGTLSLNLFISHPLVALPLLKGNSLQNKWG